MAERKSKEQLQIAEELLAEIQRNETLESALRHRIRDYFSERGRCELIFKLRGGGRRK